MLTYQVRKRTIHLAKKADVSFPASAAIRLHLRPKQPFGEEAGGGRTFVRGVDAEVHYNANTGRMLLTSHQPLSPLEVVIEEPGRTVDVRGRVVEVRQEVASDRQLAELLESLYFGLPWLLNTTFADPPYVERVEGELNGVPFRWQLTRSTTPMGSTTQEEQETAVSNAWLRFSVISAPGRRRLVAALHYYHVARRLERASETVGEFMSEALLNYCKVLEVLFYPGTRDAARAELEKLGCSPAEVERRYIPVMALRNELDIAHVHLSVLSESQLAVLHRFLEEAEAAFADLFERIFRHLEEGSWEVPAYTDLTPRNEVVSLIERMRVAQEGAEIPDPPEIVRIRADRGRGSGRG